MSHLHTVIFWCIILSQVASKIRGELDELHDILEPKDDLNSNIFMILKQLTYCLINI